MSLLYMEEMALCGLGACCFYFLWVRRTPNRGQDAIPVAGTQMFLKIALDLNFAKALKSDI